MYKKINGFTLFELIISMSLLFILLVMLGRFFNVSSKAFNLATEDYNVQTNMRNVMQVTIDKMTRTTGAFAVEDFSKDTIVSGWSYIGIETVEENGKTFTQIVEYTAQDDGTHSEKIIAPANEKLHYELNFEKNFNTSSNTDLIVTFITYKVDAYDGSTPYAKPDFSGGKVEVERIETGMRAPNSLQFVDRGEDSSSIAIAFRTAHRTLETTTGSANLMMVLDYSGSMKWGMDGEKDLGKQRYLYLKDGVDKILTKLNKFDTVLISMIGFSDTYHENRSLIFKNAKNDYENQLKNYTSITNMKDGGTNTGDGVRKAYYLMQEQRSRDASNKRDPKEYFILMIDGESNFYSSENKTGEFYTGNGDLGTDYYCDGPGNGYSPKSLEYARLMSEKVGDMDNLERYFFVCGRTVDDVKQNVPFNSSNDVYVLDALKKALRIDDSKYEDRYIVATDGDKLVEAFDGVGAAIFDRLWFVDGPVK